MFPIKEVINENNNKKNILKQIFKNVVYDRYKIINYKLNDIEKNIINRLSKKYQFNLYNNNWILIIIIIKKVYILKILEIIIKEIIKIQKKLIKIVLIEIIQEIIIWNIIIGLKCIRFK